MCRAFHRIVKDGEQTYYTSSDLEQIFGCITNNQSSNIKIKNVTTIEEFSLYTWIIQNHHPRTVQQGTKKMHTIITCRY